MSQSPTIPESALTPLLQNARRVLLVVTLVFSCSACGTFKEQRETTQVFDGPGDTVLIMHGLRWWSLGGMNWMARRFNREGYRVILVRYPSRKLDGDGIVNGYLAKTMERENTRTGQPIHFVAHSLGAVVTHRFLQDHPPANLGRCVFIGTPHHGTELADLFRRKMPWTLRLIGPAAASLNTSGDGLPDKLRPPNFPLGIIMGDRCNYPFLSPFIPGPDDGVVPVRSGMVEGALDTIVLHEAHVEMIRSPDVFSQACRFIETGAFDHAKPARRKTRIVFGSPGGVR